MRGLPSCRRPGWPAIPGEAVVVMLPLAEAFRCVTAALVASTGSLLIPCPN